MAHMQTRARTSTRSTAGVKLSCYTLQLLERPLGEEFFAKSPKNTFSHVSLVAVFWRVSFLCVATALAFVFARSVKECKKYLMCLIFCEALVIAV